MTPPTEHLDDTGTRVDLAKALVEIAHSLGCELPSLDTEAVRKWRDGGEVGEPPWLEPADDRRSVLDHIRDAIRGQAAERDRYREALERARQDIVEQLGAGWDSTRREIAARSLDAINEALEGTHAAS